MPEKMRMPAAVAVDLAHLPGELDRALLVQAVGHGQRLRVVGDGDVLVAQRARRFGHLFERRAAVGLGGVHVQVAADVFQFHQLRQAALGRGFDFAAVLAQLRRNPGQPQRLVDPGFGFAGHPRVVLRAEQAVLAELQPHPHGARAQGDVVLLAAGEILHGRAEAFAAAARARPPASLRAPPWRWPCSRRGPAPRPPSGRPRSGRAPRRRRGPVTSRSRSPTVSRPRRRLPAGVTSSTPGTCRSACVSSSAMPSA